MSCHWVSHPRSPRSSCRPYRDFRPRTASRFDAILHPWKSTVFTVMPLFDQQLATVIPFAVKQQGAGTAAVVYLDGYSPNILPAAKYAIEAAGGTMMQSIGVALSTTNWGPTVIRLREANPEFVLLVLTTPGSGQLVAEMA